MSIILVILLTQNGYVDSTIERFKELGYVGAFIAGIFYVSTFTVVPAAIILYHLAEVLDPIGIAVTAGVGGVIGDYFMFRVLRDHVFDELKPVFMKLGGNHVSRLLSTPYFGWLSPVIGAVIIASPFPDEIGVSLMGISHIRNWQFVLVTLILDILSIFIIVGAARLT